MNNDLISREALKKAYFNAINETSIGEVSIIALIDNAPTVDITEEQAIEKLHETGWLPMHDKEMTERPQGEWIFEKANEEHADGYICSNCKWSFHTRVPYFSEFNFCPNCGADMRGGNK